ncbi:hypothetical protein CHL76_09305 [Marinococcus halophilus]|uniref:Uncharacterized protein n=1 Tax=Marinococcus halophilus TaxID=1371 RepID=A0A510Y4Q6_MARHA|nr:hypothetical protein [Marinococcus halophilus]OZT80293.1 hypothetical protein CHL76_09305 [Marinococcus halophilus]GEK58356.1 hypothetical protein MHA01_12610 [Marinococcus halophilus]
MKQETQEINEIILDESALQFESAYLYLETSDPDRIGESAWTIAIYNVEQQFSEEFTGRDSISIRIKTEEAEYQGLVQFKNIEGSDKKHCHLDGLDELVQV